MILVRIRGGLGNQMFQYALGRHLAIRNGTELFLHFSPAEGDIAREFSLSDFSIHAGIAPDKIIKKVKSPKNPLVAGLKKVFSKPDPDAIRYVSEKEKFVFHPEILELPENTYLDGSWQNERYFSEIRGTLLKDFDSEKLPSAGIVDTIGACGENSVSVHFRRGDFADDPKTRAVHGVCPAEYYRNAIWEIRNRIDNPVFFIFSDDSGWVKENISLDFPHHFVNPDHRLSDTVELALMKMCRNHIIANSTFSWWGAWLSEYPDKIVIGPDKWMIGGQHDYSDLLPAGWIRLE